MVEQFSFANFSYYLYLHYSLQAVQSVALTRYQELGDNFSQERVGLNQKMEALIDGKTESETKVLSLETSNCELTDHLERLTNEHSLAFNSSIKTYEEYQVTCHRTVEAMKLELEGKSEALSSANRINATQVIEKSDLEDRMKSLVKEHEHSLIACKRNVQELVDQNKVLTEKESSEVKLLQVISICGEPAP